MNSFLKENKKRNLENSLRKNVRDKFFIEIGSSDFDTLLPLARNGWGGIIVEPNSSLLSNLDRYNNIIYENVAIMNYDGKTSFKFYDIEFMDEKDPVNCIKRYSKRCHPIRGMSTTNFEFNNFNVNNNEFFKNYENVKEVICMTLDSLVEKHKVEQIDFLKIDAETKDHEILFNYSWEIKPVLIKAETLHWNAMKRDGIINYDLYETMTPFLEQLGYIVFYEKQDLYAIR